MSTVGPRAIGILLVGLCVALAAPGRVAAIQSPPGCTGNGVGLSARGNELEVEPGATATYQLSVYNLDDPSINMISCDAEFDLLFYCPGADGEPDFANPIVIATNVSLPAGTPPTAIGGSPSCIVNLSPGVMTATARVRLGDQMGDLDDLSEGASHVATFDQPFRRDQFVLIEVPGNVASTTTSTIPTTCGNGVREGSEECDPGQADTECCSFLLGCFTFKPRLNLPCGAQRRPSACSGDVCTADGQCSMTVVAADPPVRCRPQSDACDLGDFCDGVNVDCPTSRLCNTDLAPAADRTGIEVSCDAPLTDGMFECSAMGFATARRSPRGEVDVMTCGKRPYTERSSVGLVATGDAQTVNGRLTLTLDPAARRVLRKKGAVRVCVAVSTKLDGIVVKTTRRLVTVDR